MRLSISGGRADGREWPSAGYELILPDGEAEDLIRGGMAYPHPQGYEVAGGPAAPAAPEAEPPFMSPPAETAAGPAGPGSSPPDPGPGTGPPPAYAPKQAWVDYAMAHGATEDEANMQTKASLMETYGERP